MSQGLYQFISQERSSRQLPVTMRNNVQQYFSGFQGILARVCQLMSILAPTYTILRNTDSHTLIDNAPASIGFYTMINYVEFI